MDDRHINAYRQIKAPDELKKKIIERDLREYHINSFNFKKLSHRSCTLTGAVVAVILIVFVISGMNNTKMPIVRIQNETLGTNPIVISENNDSVAMADSREVPTLYVSMEIESEEDTVLKVLDGVVFVSKDSVTNEIMQGEQCALNGTYQVLWNMNQNISDNGSRIILKNGQKEYSIIVNYNVKTNQYEICQK